MRAFQSRQLRATACFIALGLSFLIGTSNLYAVPIDHFDGPLDQQTLHTIGSANSADQHDESFFLSSGSFGGERDAALDQDVGNDTGEANVRVNPEILGLPSSRYTLSANARNEPTGLIQWDGVDNSMTLNPTGLGMEDLTLGGVDDRFILGIFRDDFPADLTLTVYTDADHFSKHTLELPGLIHDPTEFEIPYADFTPDPSATGGANFEKVGAIELLIEASPNTDFQLDFLFTGTNVDPAATIPEPSTLVSLLGGLFVGLVFCGRRRSRRHGGRGTW